MLSVSPDRVKVALIQPEHRMLQLDVILSILFAFLSVSDAPGFVLSTLQAEDKIKNR